MFLFLDNLTAAHVAQYAAFASRPLSALLADAKAPALARAMFAYALGHGMGEPTVAAAAAAAANVLLASKSPATATAAAISAANDASVGELLTKDAARRTKGIMTSLGRFGQKGAHLYPSYGISELAQAFARYVVVISTNSVRLWIEFVQFMLVYVSSRFQFFIFLLFGGNFTSGL